MSRIVGVHGISQELKGEESLRNEWLPSLRDGLRRAGFDDPQAVLPDADFACAFFGDLFRKKGTKALGFPPLDVDDLDAWEQDLLEVLWLQVSARDAAPRGGQTKSPEILETGRRRTLRGAQRMLNRLLSSKSFSRLTERALLFHLQQVKRYLHDPELRAEAHSRLAKLITPATRVVIGHSLGSVVAYEVLAAQPEGSVRTFVTLGSPLGCPKLIFDRLCPPPEDGRGGWPGAVEHWFNLADGSDPVALVTELASCFGPRVKDELVHNGADVHKIGPYLTAEETGRAIATGLLD